MARSSTQPGGRRAGGAASGAPTTRPTGLLPGSESGRVAGELLAGRSARAVPEVLPPNTTALQKTVFETEDTGEDLEGREVRVVRAQKGDTLSRILAAPGRRAVAGARHDGCGQARSLPMTAMLPGQEVHVTLVPSVTRANRVEPVRFSVFGEGQDHKVTVTRNAAGEFVASASPIDERVGQSRRRRRRPAAGFEPLRQLALHRRAAGHAAPT